MPYEVNHQSIIMIILGGKPSIIYSRHSKISNNCHLPKRSRQTVQSKIRLLLMKQSDQALPVCYSNTHFVDFSLCLSISILHICMGAASIGSRKTVQRSSSANILASNWEFDPYP